MKTLWVTLAVVVVVAAIGTIIQGMRANMKINEAPEGSITVLSSKYFPFNRAYSKGLFSGRMQGSSIAARCYCNGEAQGGNLTASQCASKCRGEA